MPRTPQRWLPAPNPLPSHTATVQEEDLERYCRMPYDFHLIANIEAHIVYCGQCAKKVAEIVETAVLEERRRSRMPTEPTDSIKKH